MRDSAICRARCCKNSRWKLPRLATLAGALLVFPTKGAVFAQENCEQLRAPLTQPLIEALAARKPDDIQAALKNLAKTEAFNVPADPIDGRRPFREAHSIRLSREQLQRRAQRLFRDTRQNAWWLRTPVSSRRIRRTPLSTLASKVRSLLAIARGFPELEQVSRKLARQTGDFLIKAGQDRKFPATPLAPSSSIHKGKPYFRGSLQSQLGACPALRQSVKNGWFIAPVSPEMHYGETSLVGEAMVRLARDTGEQRFLEWAREASRWLTSRPIAADFTANAQVAGFDAEIFILTAEKKYLDRAMDWASFGVLPMFEGNLDNARQDGSGQVPDLPFIARLTLADLAAMTRALVHVSTAVATAPLGSLEEPDIHRVYQATRQAYALLQRRAIQRRRLQIPAQLIEIAIDVERAQLAGAPLPDPEQVAFRLALAHGADRVQRFVDMPGAANGRLLEKLMMRGWSGAFRTLRKRNAAASKAADKN